MHREQPPATVLHSPGPVVGGIRWRGWKPAFTGNRRAAATHAGRKPEAEENLPALPAYAGPDIITTPPVQTRAGEEYVYQATARDASVDGFSWSLQSSPPGMTVDRYSGRVTWTPSTKCRVRIELCARTVHGHETVQSWTLSVAKPVVVHTVVPHPRFVAALEHKRLRDGSSPVTHLQVQRGLQCLGRTASRGTGRRLDLSHRRRTLKTRRGRRQGVQTLYRVRFATFIFCSLRTATKRAAAGIDCRAAAPPVRPPGAAVMLPLRL